MDEALLTLLAKKDLQYISVKEICEKAGVNRSTFYLHYENISDLLNEAVEYTLSEFSLKFEGIIDIKKEELESAPAEELLFITPKYLIPYLEFMRENQCFFAVVVTRPSVLRVNDIFNKRYAEVYAPIMKRFGIGEKEGKYRLSFYLNGIFALISEWIKGGCTEPPEQIADFISSSILPKTLEP